MPDRNGQLLLEEIPARARNTHPVQSHMAAEKKNESDTLSKDRLRVLTAIFAFPGYTAKQIDALGCFGKAHRRSVDLERKGYIYRIGVKNDGTNREEMISFITEKGKDILEGE